MTTLFTKRSARVGALSIVAAGALVATTVVPAIAAEEPDPYVLGDDGTTAVAYDYDSAVKESVWVDAPDLDGDGDGEKIALDIVRPAELDGAADVPVIMDASPYYSTSGRGNEAERKTYDENGVIEKSPLYYDNYFVPRGYAYVSVDMAGTSRSTGCVDQGGPSDILSAKAAVDWLNGNATATYADGSAAVADWSNGKTGMIGKSYDGTIANGVAAMAPDGLETIVPISAISSWYDYDRAQNIPYSYGYPRWLSSYVGGNRTMPQDCTAIWDQMDIDAADDTGLYTDWWAERDYREGTLGDASQIEASVFIMHGLQDTNVDMHHVSRFWELLVENDVDRKMLLTRLGHVDAFDSDRDMWVDTLHRWFDQELMGIENGMSDEPAVDVEVAPNEWAESDSWPIVDRVAKLRPKANGSLSLGAGGRQGSAAWVNDRQQRFGTALADGENPHRLLFTTGVLRDDLRLSGTASVSTTVTTSADVGQITVGLVDYGPADRVLTQNDGAVTLDTESCWGESSDVDDACYFDVERSIGETDYQVLGRGWARLDGGTQRVTVEMLPNDLVVPAGHQLGLVVMGVDRGATVTLDGAASEYEIDLKQTSLDLPVVGPMSSFAPGQSLVPSPDEIDDSIVTNDIQLLP
ncbi:CocE/NonD family hydrolase [Microbacterium sp. G2-8]|uniref:CocE/NonD family hydrolase n=1 Tax=Microbacterium sp. G2-8 TaxID=2842454 RepID=UPI001C893C14|nr:CocE/NonD family hydrolase [Microbacterium sp. G2-8]